MLTIIYCSLVVGIPVAILCFLVWFFCCVDEFGFVKPGPVSNMITRNAEKLAEWARRREKEE